MGRRGIIVQVLHLGARRRQVITSGFGRIIPGKETCSMQTVHQYVSAYRTQNTATTLSMETNRTIRKRTKKEGMNQANFIRTYMRSEEGDSGGMS